MHRTCFSVATCQLMMSAELCKAPRLISVQQKSLVRPWAPASIADINLLNPYSIFGRYWRSNPRGCKARNCSLCAPQSVKRRVLQSTEVINSWLCPPSQHLPGTGGDRTGFQHFAAVTSAVLATVVTVYSPGRHATSSGNVPRVGHSTRLITCTD